MNDRLQKERAGERELVTVSETDRAETRKKRKDATECTLFLDMLYPSVLETGRNPLHLMILEHCDTQTH